MNAAGPIKKRRNHERCQRHSKFAGWKHIDHHPVNCHWPIQSNEGKENNVYIVMPETKDVENGKDFNKCVSFQVIPIGTL